VCFWYSKVVTHLEGEGQLGQEHGSWAETPPIRVLSHSLAYLGEVVQLTGEAIAGIRHGVNTGDFFRQANLVGIGSIPIAMLIVGFSGAVLSYYSVSNFSAFGVESLVGNIVSVSIVKETGPLFACLAIASRAGTNMAAEIGTMKVTEQIDALKAMAVSPVAYLVTPRLLASLIMVPIVTIFADVMGVVGGGIMAQQRGLLPHVYWAGVQASLRTDGWDILGGLLKSVFFGLIIAMIGCTEGLRTKGGANGVGKSTTRSIVLIIVFICAIDLLLTPVIFP
jgi:phospholipid/cholesterol/gamma-HCH transport system permease protein